MAISSEITRIKDGRNRIRTKMVNLGIASETDKLDALAEKLEGVTDNGSVGITIDGIETTSATIPAGYTSGGTVSLSDAIEKALAAI